MANTAQEVINTQLNAKIEIQNTKIDAFIDEMRDFKREVRENQAEMKNIGRHVRNITIASLIGIGAMVLASGAMAITVIYSVFNHG